MRENNAEDTVFQTSRGWAGPISGQLHIVSLARSNQVEQIKGIKLSGLEEVELSNLSLITLTKSS